MAGMHSAKRDLNQVLERDRKIHWQSEDSLLMVELLHRRLKEINVCELGY